LGFAKNLKSSVSLNAGRVDKPEGRPGGGVGELGVDSGSVIDLSIRGADGGTGRGSGSPSQLTLSALASCSLISVPSR